jgi:hypothetical protein
VPPLTHRINLSPALQRIAANATLHEPRALQAHADAAALREQLIADHVIVPAAPEPPLAHARGAIAVRIDAIGLRSAGRDIVAQHGRCLGPILRQCDPRLVPLLQRHAPVQEAA